MQEGQASGRSRQLLADEEGFEPPEPLGSTVFKTAAIDHSATHPSECAEMDNSERFGKM